MDDAHKIVLHALEQAGVTLPAGADNFLSPSSLIAICTSALVLLEAPSVPPTSSSSSLPASMADRYRICTALASSINDLGYQEDLSFHQFLYPSEEETYKLLRFLLDKLSTSSVNASGIKKGDRDRFANDSITDGLHESTPSQQGLVGKNKATDVLGLEDARVSNSLPEMKTCALITSPENPQLMTSSSELNSEIPLCAQEATARDVMVMGEGLLEEQVVSGKEHQEKSASCSLEAQEDLRQRDLSRLEERLSILCIEKKKSMQEVADWNRSIKDLESECEASFKKVEGMKRDRDFLKCAAEVPLNTSLPEDTTMLRKNPYAEQEMDKVLLEAITPMQDEELQGKLQELNKVREQIEDMEVKLKRREDELAVLTMKLEGGVKGPLRGTHVQRITELIKNSKKQDNDISRIIGEIRELQRQSNANQGRLKRVYALVDELVFRDAQKDPLCRQAYRLLTSIHEDFAECYEKVFAIDRMRAEIADLQGALEAMERCPVDLKQVQADIDVLVAENKSIERRLEAMNKQSVL